MDIRVPISLNLLYEPISSKPDQMVCFDEKNLSEIFNGEIPSN